MKLVPSTVRWRVTAAATGAIVVVLGAVGWGLVVNHRRELTNNLDERLTEIAEGNRCRCPSRPAARCRAARRRRLGRPVLAAGVLALLTCVLVGRTLRPVERIRTEVASIDGSDLYRRVPVPPADDEIGRLATTMNDMLGRVERAQARQRRFVADASHGCAARSPGCARSWRSTSSTPRPPTRRRPSAGCSKR